MIKMQCNIHKWICQKTQKTPKSEIEKAKMYRNNYLEV